MTLAADTSEANSPLEVVWGADAIAAKIKRSPRATFHLLESGSLPGAKKVAGRWCFNPAVFLSSLAAPSSNTPAAA